MSVKKIEKLNKHNADELVVLQKENTRLEVENNLIKSQFPTGEKTELYTSEKQDAYDQIKEACSYKNTTHIFSTDEVGSIFEVTYFKDLETLLAK